MSHRRSLLTLPPELIYIILDNLDIETITLTFHNVCTRFQTITDNYQRYQTMTTLNFNEKKIGNQGIQSLAYVLRKTTTLVNLSLVQIDISKTGIQNLAIGLQNNTTLNILDLRANSIGTHGIKYLTDALMNHLNEIGDRGTKQISKMLENNKTLEKLNLRFNTICCQGLEHLADALKINQTLQVLVISQNQFDERKIYHVVNKIKMFHSHLKLW